MAITTAHASQNATPLRVIGIVEVPRLSPFVILPDGTWRARDKDSPEQVHLRQRASLDSRIVANISSLDAVKVEKLEPELRGAVVFARERDWSQLETTAGVVGWLAAADAGTYHPLESLLRREMTAFTGAWDRRLGTSPDVTMLARLPTDPRKRMIGYLKPAPEDAVVFLEAGTDPEPLRERFKVRNMGSTTYRDGTKRVTLHLESWISAFERPDLGSPVLARFQSPSSAGVLRGTLNTHPPDIAVFDRRPGWFQVALHRDEDDWWNEPKVWVQDAVVWRFREISGGEWERKADEIWRQDWQENAVRVLSMRDVGGVKWLEVEVLSHSSCVSNEPPTVKARGWLPAYAPSGELNVWFWADC